VSETWKHGESLVTNGASADLNSTSSLSLSKEAFDVVVCLVVLKHVPDSPSLVRELSSYSRPGGRLIVPAPFWYTIQT
jgi:2-polyprenyl-3-methyl-5-hydroxy-6-metoxy-1,4-benzoquinol methylase